MWSILIEKKIHIHYNDLYEFYNFGTPFPSHHYYTLSLSDLCLEVEEKIFKEIMHFHYMTYMATAPGVMKFTILVDPSLSSYLYTYFVCSMPGRREEDF